MQKRGLEETRIDKTCSTISSAHHWMIGSLVPGQPENQGTCRFCRTTRRFQTHFIDGAYDRRIGPTMAERDLAEQIRRDFDPGE